MSKNKPIFFILFLTTLCLQFFAVKAQDLVAGDSWQNIKTKGYGRIVVYYNLNTPFIYQNAQGKLEGIEYELITATIAYLEKKYQVRIEVDWVRAKGFQNFYNTLKTTPEGIIGVASLSITEARKKEIQFSPPYMPDIEIIVSSADVPTFEKREEFLEATKNLKAVALPNSTREKNLLMLKEKYLSNLQYELVKNSDELLQRILNNEKYWAYLQLPTYILLLKEGKKINRQKFFKVEHIGLAIGLPLKSDWKQPIDEFFESESFKPFINQVIQKYIGTSAVDLVWQISKQDSSKALSEAEEIQILTAEKELQNKNLEEKELQITKQAFYTNLLIVSLVFLLALGLLFFYLYRIRQEHSKEIAHQSKKLEKSYSDLNRLSEIGRHITANLSFEKIAEVVYEGVTSFMDTREFAIGVYNEERQEIVYEIYFYEKTKVPGLSVPIAKNKRISVIAFLEQKEIIMNDISTDYLQYFDSLEHYKQGDLLNSLICLPLVADGESMGIMSVQSNKVNAYSDYQQDILRTFAVYTSIAIKNAKAYKKINEQHQEIRRQKEEIEKKNYHITASIIAAQAIQEGLLPYESRIQQTLREHFTIYLPKDIVSGDFYWLAKIGNAVFVAMLDCTGHGVPGAFMSMISYALLNEIVNSHQTLDPARILAELHIQIRKALKQDISDNKEGMDIAFCRLEPQNEGRTLVTFAGAKMPLYYVHQGKVGIMQGDRKSIGGWQKETYRTFENKTLILEKNDLIYLSSDGFIDNPSPKRKRFGLKNFMNMLQENADLPLDQQKNNIIKTLYQHQKNADQRDDIALLGFRI